MINSLFSKERFLGMSLQVHFLILCTLSLIQAYVGNSFTDNAWITFPQFSDLEYFTLKMEVISALVLEQEYSNLWSFFKAFFILDCFWSFVILSFVFRFVAFLLIGKKGKENEISSEKSKSSEKAKGPELPKPIFWFLILLTVIASLAFCFDVYENMLYLSKMGSDSFSKGFLEKLDSVVMKKKAFFGATGVLAIFVVVFKVVNKSLFDSLILLFRTSFLSLIVIGIIVILITSIGQGTTIIVDFMEHPIDILTMLASMYYISIIIAHYPIYFGRVKQNDSDWKIAGPLKKWGIGIIYFSYKKIKRGKEKCPQNCGKKKFLNQLKDENNLKRKNRELYKRIRKYLGVLVHLSIIYVIFFVGAKTFQWKLSAFSLTGAVFVLLTWIYIWFYSDRWSKGEKVFGSQFETIIDKNRDYYRRDWPYLLATKYPIALIILIILIISTALISNFHGWSEITLISVQITLIWSAVVLMIFKRCRSYFKYVFLSETTLKIEETQGDWPKPGGMFRENFPLDTLKTLLKDSRPNKIWNWMHIDRLSNNVVFLRLIKVGTVITTAFIIGINYSIDWAIMVNPFNIILLYLAFFYSLIVSYYKTYLFRQNQSAEASNRNRPVICRPENLLAFIAMFVVVWHFIAPTFHSDLHDIKITESYSVPKSLETYKTEWIKKSQKQRPVILASYGGGLKADIWNLLLFQEIQKKTKGRFWRNSICWSGVSGGTMGISNYFSMYRFNQKGSALYNNDFDFLDKKIDKLGKFNFLSIDVGMLMGRDYFRELIPQVSGESSEKGWNGEDRSYMAMKYHSRLTGMGDCEFDKHSFIDLNNDLYDYYGHVPAFIVNTVSTNGHQGIACSIGLPGEVIVPGTIDILNEDRMQDSKNDLTFYGASSTTNRFPLLAPSARVVGKGHFLDGGYFDNSGLVSAWEFYQSWNKVKTEYDLSDSISPAPIFVNIVNDKDSYIRFKLKEWGIEQFGDQAQGEFGAILSAVASLDKVPNYISEKLEDSIFIEIQMPIRFNMTDVIDLLSGEPDQIKTLAEKIRINNKQIEESLDLANAQFLASLRVDSNRVSWSEANYNRKKWGIVDPPLARLMSEPAVEYQKAMIQYHPHIAKQIELLDKRMRE